MNLTTSNETAYLNVQHVTKHYRTRPVVKNISLTVNEGEVVGLLGPNGAGKTTTFYMIAGLIACEEGKIFLNNTDVTSLPLHERALRGMSYLPQESSIFRKLSVKENILAVLELNPQLNRSARHQRMEELLHEFHLTHLSNQAANLLSGGERRRLEIARALATMPKLFLLDEPFAGVDPISVSEIKQLIKNLQAKGMGILITDHNVRETLDICNRAYIVNHGEVLCTGSPQDVLKHPKVKEVYLGEAFYL